MESSDSRRHRRPRARLAAALAGVFMCLLTARSARADQVIGPGQEARILALFAPSELGDEATPGFRLTGVNIEARQIRVQLESTAAPSTMFEVRLVSHDAPTSGRVSLAESDSFVLVVDTELGDAHRAAVLQLATRIRANDDGSFWTEVAVESSSPQAESGFSIGLRALVALLLVVVGVTEVVVRLRRRKAHTQKPN